jgi:hypothetical protein
MHRHPLVLEEHAVRISGFGLRRSSEQERLVHQGDHALLAKEPLVDFTVGAQIWADWPIGVEVPRGTAWIARMSIILGGLGD